MKKIYVFLGYKDGQPRKFKLAFTNDEAGASLISKYCSFAEQIDMAKLIRDGAQKVRDASPGQQFELVLIDGYYISDSTGKVTETQPVNSSIVNDWLYSAFGVNQNAGATA